jgi:hypothetical protein
MEMKTLKVLIIDDDDLDSPLPGISRIKGGSQIAWDADIILHQNGTLIKSRYTGLPNA